MMQIYLKTNNEKFEMAEQASANDFFNNCVFPKSDARVVAVEINGKPADLATILQDQDVVEMITLASRPGLDIMRHSTAHILAMALRELQPSVRLATGPAVENGFYYDVESEKSFSLDDLEKIQEKMVEIVKRNLPFRKEVISVSEALELFRNNEFKTEILHELDCDEVSIYHIGDEFFDLCRGPHLARTGDVNVDSFKLLEVAGAYWRGDSCGKRLQRIYGTVWPSLAEMNKYFFLLDEAKARDHRKLGPMLEIFHLDEAAPGGIFWLKNGHILFCLIKDYISKVIEKYGYFQVQTPVILNKNLWETSGHWEKFMENMFIVNDFDKNPMAVKPMNCPGHVVIFKTGAVKSYRDLPYRIAEFGICHRNEASGALHGLLRLRGFTQDDGHVFCTRDQIVSETIDICAAIKEVYAAFGFLEMAVKFSDRPKKRAGSDEIWDLAEDALKEAAHSAGLTYSINQGEGAFYGPKLEFVLKDSLGREWQCGTLQVDFVLPERFDLHYIDRDGEKQRPVMLHRALAGSLERFIGILIEHYAGAFPFWLAPVQIAIATITQEASEYALFVKQLLKKAGLRTILDDENQKITYKIRQHSVRKIPAIVVLGAKEVENRTISVRFLGENKTEVFSLDEAVKRFLDLGALFR